MSREQYFSPLPLRFEQTITDLRNNNSNYKDLLRKSWAKVLSTTNRRASIDLHQRMDSIKESFIGDGIYIEERLGDILLDCITTPDTNLRNRLLSSAFIVLDLNEFRAFDLADKDTANINANKTGEIIQGALRFSGQDYDNIVARIFGDEYYILRVPKKHKAFSEMKVEHVAMLNIIGEEIRSLSGPKIVNSDPQPVVTPLSSKAKGAFLCEGIAQTPNLDQNQNQRDQFMVTVRKIREKLVDAKDMDQKTASYFPRTVNLEGNMPKDCFGPTDELDLQRDMETSDRYVSSDNYQKLLIENLEIEEREPENKNYLTINFYPLWIRRMLDILTTEQGFDNLALPLINMIAEYPLIDPFTRIVRSPIYTPEGFKQCIFQELQQLSPDEDIGLIAIDPAMIKEVNTYLGWQVSDNFLIKIYTMLSKHYDQAAQSKSESNKFYVMKEGGRIFIAIKNKAVDLSDSMVDLKRELDELCLNMIVPITGQSSLLEQRPDLIKTRFKLFGTDCPKVTTFHTPSSLTTFRYIHSNLAIMGQKRKDYFHSISETQKAIGVAMDYVRDKADRNKTLSFLKYLIHGKPEAFLFFDKYGGRFATRKAKAKAIIIEGIMNSTIDAEAEKKKFRFIFFEKNELDFIEKAIHAHDQQFVEREETIAQRFRSLSPEALQQLEHMKYRRTKFSPRGVAFARQVD